VRDASITIEAVPEDLAMKRALFAEIEAHAPDTALLATNTSSLSISQIATAVNTPGRVVGVHFFNPVHAMKLVEIVRGRMTTDATVQRAEAFATALGGDTYRAPDVLRRLVAEGKLGKKSGEGFYRWSGAER